MGESGNNGIDNKKSDKSSKLHVCVSGDSQVNDNEDFRRK